MVVSKTSNGENRRNEIFFLSFYFFKLFFATRINVLTMAVPINVASIPWFDPHGEQNSVAHRLEKWLTVDFSLLWPLGNSELRC